MEKLVNDIALMTTAIELAKQKEMALIFLDLANRGKFVDPHEWAEEDMFLDTEWGCNELVMLFKTLNRNCPGLVEFKKQKGFIGFIKHPAMRVSDMGLKIAEMIKNNKQIVG